VKRPDDRDEHQLIICCAITVMCFALMISASFYARSRDIAPPSAAPLPAPVRGLARFSALALSCPEGGGTLVGVGRVMCEANNWVAGAMSAIAEWVAQGWPLAYVGVVVGMLGVLIALLRAVARMRVAEDAVWLEITPPASLHPGGALGVWRMLAGCLRHAPRRLIGPRPHLAAEWWADPTGVRAGIWVPPAVRPGRVAAAIERAWPGTAARETYPPVWHRYPTRLLELVPAEGPWAPLLDPHHRQPNEPGDEPLRAVLGTLAERGPGEQACVQLVVSTHRGRPTATHSGNGPGAGPAGLLRAHLRAAAPALLGSLTGALAALVLGVLDLLTGRATPRRPTPSGGVPGRRDRSDPETAAARGAAAAKRGTGPHLCATLRVAVSVPMPATWGHDRARAVDIATGYELVTSQLRLRWRRFWAPERITLRTHGPAAWVATLPELVALWHLPAEPGLYRMAAPGARRMGARGDIRRKPDGPTHQPPSGHNGPDRGGHRARPGGQAPRRLPPTAPPAPPRNPRRPDTPPSAPGGRSERRAPGAGPANAHTPARPTRPTHAARLTPPPGVSRLPRRTPRRIDGGGESR
jgi:hypothetical protein